MIEWMASSCILTAAVIALRYLLRGKISLRLQYALWLLVLARLLLPVSFGSTDLSVMSVVEKAPAVQAVESVRHVDAVWQTNNGFVQGHPIGGAANNTVTLAEPSAPEGQFHRMTGALTARRVLLPLWWCGAGGTLLVFLAVNLRFSRRLRKNRRPLAVEGAALPVYVAQERAVPCLFGLFRPAIYVTAETAADPDLLRHTVAHETTHFHQGDHVWALLRTLCLALHWWDPLVWWAAKLSRQDGELACDEATVRTLGEAERAAYGRTLIRMACGRGVSPLLTATAMDGGRTSLHERIVLLAKKPRTAALAAIALVLAAALCVGCTFTGAKKDEAAARPDTIAGYMAALTADHVADWDVKQYPDITLGRLVAAMNRAADSQITQEEAVAAGDNDGKRYWGVSFRDGDGLSVTLTCNDAAADIVHFSLTNSADHARFTDGGNAFFRDTALYDLVRHAQTDVSIDYNNAYETFRPQLDAAMQRTLDGLANDPGGVYAYQLVSFSLTWQYETSDGNRAELYQFDYALLAENPAEVTMAGAMYLDGQQRLRGFSNCGNVVARYKDDTLLGLVFMGSDNYYVPPFDEDWAWASDMLAAMQQASRSSLWTDWPDKAELTTQTFTYLDLTVQVTDVYMMQKGQVWEDADEVFENDIYIVSPGATFTVLESGSENGADSVPHANWLYYAPDGAAAELWPGDTVPIISDTSIGHESFPVLRFYLYDGWLQAPSADPLASVRTAIEAEGHRSYARNVRVDALSLNEAETQRVSQSYLGSDLAIGRGWSDDLLTNHFLVVDAAYYIEYDHTRTFLEGGNVTQQFYLAQNDQGRWIIVDNAMRIADGQEENTVW